MMNKDKTKKDEGDKILTNYKKQISEKMAREKIERGETIATSGSFSSIGFGKKTSNGKNNS